MPKSASSEIDRISEPSSSFYKAESTCEFASMSSIKRVDAVNYNSETIGSEAKNNQVDDFTHRNEESKVDQLRVNQPQHSNR